MRKAPSGCFSKGSASSGSYYDRFAGEWTENELLREAGEDGENAVPQTEVSSRMTFSSAMAERIVAELGEVSARLEQWQREEAEYVQTHLFLQDRQRDILKNALRRVRSDITSLEIESQELSHAAGRKLS